MKNKQHRSLETELYLFRSDTLWDFFLLTLERKNGVLRRLIFVGVEVVELHFSFFAAFWA